MEFSDVVGKTIQSATQMKRPETDDDGWLLLEFTDGTRCMVVAYYGGYTGDSEDEYPTGICISEKVEGFVPVPSSA
ncbi:hypothetical protein V7x_55940 [Crateriforma conspicua]|uniref:Uncharacterized protein n=1 Tax=Crateriforma conspicua TaxID=2527996 RepID=A0A5C6FHL5_9PLAN|nr:hypothetical protein V7x_55940 [Crateriforma conspicua]